MKYFVELSNDYSSLPQCRMFPIDNGSFMDYFGEEWPLDLAHGDSQESLVVEV